MKYETKYQMKKSLLDSLFGTLMVFLALWLIPIILEVEDFLDPFEKTFIDFQITDANYSELREPSVINADQNIVIIDVEELNTQGYIMLLAKLSYYEPKVIGIDRLIYSSGNELEDLALKSILENTKNIVFAGKLVNPKPQTLEYDGFDLGDTTFSSMGTIGFNNLLFEKNKEYTTVRQFFVKVGENDNLIYSFPVEIVRLYDESIFQRLMDRGNDAEIINYRGNFNKFHYAVGSKIVEEDIEMDFVADKIVLLGVDGSFRGYDLLEELYFTPMNERTSGRSFPDMSQVVIFANIISMLIEGNYINAMPTWLSIVLTFILCFNTMMIYSYISRKNKKWYEVSSLLIFVLESLLILTITVYIFDLYDYQIKLTEALFAIALSVFVYQIYVDSVKPIIKKFYKFMVKR